MLDQGLVVHFLFYIIFDGESLLGEGSTAIPAAIPLDPSVTQGRVGTVGVKPVGIIRGRIEVFTVGIGAMGEGLHAGLQ